MIQRTVVVSDLQVPYHDEVAVKNLGAFIRAWKPHKVVTIGDEIDLPQISRWTEGTPGWYEQTLVRSRWSEWSWSFSCLTRQQLAGSRSQSLLRTVAEAASGAPVRHRRP